MGWPMELFETLGRYFLVRKIARGGMADVYRAKLLGVEGFEKDVAIKVLLPQWSENRDFIRMLVDEAKVLLHLNHANIVQVYELNLQDQTYFLVMEFIDGVDLKALTTHLKETQLHLTPSLISYIGRQILQGLQYAHEKKVVHRDISPQNILISFDGTVKITDFGIAKAMGRTTETAFGTLKGKFAYMSPEQAMGREVDAQTDLFAVGILFYEMLTQEACFKGVSDMEILEAVKNQPIKIPDDLAPSFLKEIILTCLERDKTKRYSSSDKLLKVLRQEEQTPDQICAAELKLLLSEMCSDQKREENSNATRVHLETLRTKGVRDRTKILVGRKIVQIADKNLGPSQQPANKTVLNRWTEVFPLWRRYVRQSLTIAVLMTGATTWWFWPKAEIPVTQPLPPVVVTMPQTQPQPEPQLISEERIVVEVPKEDYKTEKKEMIILKPLEFGKLIVAATPWGRVTIPDHLNGVETPLSKKIPEGSYTMTVLYPPGEQLLSTSIKIAKDATTRCQVRFGRQPHISCR